MAAIIPPMAFDRKATTQISSSVAGAGGANTMFRRGTNFDQIVISIKRRSASLPIPRRPPRHKKIVKRSCPSAIWVETEEAEHQGETQYFRCDIFASSADKFAETEEECRLLVAEAGGKVLDRFEYLAGFLYSLPLDVLNPLTDGEEVVDGGSIGIKCWAPFAALRDKPSSTDVRTAEHVARSRFSDDHGGKRWPRMCDAMTKQRVSAWIEERKQRNSPRLAKTVEFDGQLLAVAEEMTEGGTSIKDSTRSMM